MFYSRRFIVLVFGIVALSMGNSLIFEPLPSVAGPEKRNTKQLLFPIRVDKKWGLIDRQGKVVHEAKYDDLSWHLVDDNVERWKAGREYLAKKDDQWWHLTSDGANRVELPANVTGTAQIAEGMFRYDTTTESRSPRSSHLLDLTGKFDLPEGVQIGLGRMANQRIPVRRGDKFGFANPSGKVVIPIRYDKVYTFSESFSAVKVGKKWGYIDIQGHLKIPPQFEVAHHFHDGYAVVLKKGELFFIDDKGDRLQTVPFDNAAKGFRDGLAVLYTRQSDASDDEDIITVINTDGEIVFRPPPKVSGLGAFSQGLSPFSFAAPPSPDNGYLDREGNIAIRLYAEDLHRFDHGLAWVERARGGNGLQEKSKRSGYIDRSGRWVWQTH